MGLLIYFRLQTEKNMTTTGFLLLLELHFFPSSEGSKSQFAKVSLAPRRNFKLGSISITKASRFSVSQSEGNHSVKPTRSSSVTRPSVSSYSNYSSNSGTPILNTSSASVSSYTRPSSPITCSLSAARPSTPSPRSTSRSSTPSKVRSSPNGFYIDKRRPSQSSRASTPTSRLQIHANLNSKAFCSNSRSTTPHVGILHLQKPVFHLLLGALFSMATVQLQHPDQAPKFALT